MQKVSFSTNSNEGIIDRIFKLTENKTNIKTEILAGFTTFIAMAYILFVNPPILAQAGIPVGAAVASTAIASAFACIVMGLFANYPIAIAPGMGLNVFFTFTVVQGMGVPWEVALGAVFLSGILFIILTVTKLRQAIIDAVPNGLRSAIVGGIGIFISFVGFTNAKIVVANPGTFIGLGNMSDPGVLIACFGIVITGLLYSKKIKGSLIIGMFVTTILSMFAGVAKIPRGLNDIITFTPPSVSGTFMKMDIHSALSFGMVAVVLSITIVGIFDNMGTLIACSRKAGLVDDKGNMVNMDKALLADSIATCAGGVIGTSPVCSYIESGAGVAAGGRTGLTSVVVGILFLVALFFSPLISIIPSQAIAPVLIVVGVLFMNELGNINFEDFTEGLPAFLTITLMAFTSSIAQGISFGFISYTALKLLSGNYKEVHPIMYVVSVLLMVNFVVIGGH